MELPGWMGFYQWLVKVSWLGRLVLEFWWVELGFFSLYLRYSNSGLFGRSSGWGFWLLR